MRHPTPSPPLGSLSGQRDVRQLSAKRYRLGTTATNADNKSATKPDL